MELGGPPGGSGLPFRTLASNDCEVGSTPVGFLGWGTGLLLPVGKPGVGPRATFGSWVVTAGIHYTHGSRCCSSKRPRPVNN